LPPDGITLERFSGPADTFAAECNKSMQDLSKHWQDKSTSIILEHTKKLESYLMNNLQRKIDESEKEKEAAI
jgi:hypothetical protein